MVASRVLYVLVICLFDYEIHVWKTDLNDGSLFKIKKEKKYCIESVSGLSTCTNEQTRERGTKKKSFHSPNATLLQTKDRHTRHGKIKRSKLKTIII